MIELNVPLLRKANRNFHIHFFQRRRFMSVASWRALLLSAESQTCSRVRAAIQRMDHLHHKRLSIDHTYKAVKYLAARKSISRYGEVYCCFVSLLFIYYNHAFVMFMAHSSSIALYELQRFFSTPSEATVHVSEATDGNPGEEMFFADYHPPDSVSGLSSIPVPRSSKVSPVVSVFFLSFFRFSFVFSFFVFFFFFFASLHREHRTRLFLSAIQQRMPLFPPGVQKKA